ncbi:hypothetical protein SDDV_ORF139 [Scale drop disease virus]
MRSINSYNTLEINFPVLVPIGNFLPATKHAPMPLLLSFSPLNAVPIKMSKLSSNVARLNGPVSHTLIVYRSTAIGVPENVILSTNSRT